MNDAAPTAKRARTDGGGGEGGGAGAVALRHGQGAIAVVGTKDATEFKGVQFASTFQEVLFLFLKKGDDKDERRLAAAAARNAIGELVGAAGGTRIASEEIVKDVLSKVDLNLFPELRRLCTGKCKKLSTRYCVLVLKTILCALVSGERKDIPVCNAYISQAIADRLGNTRDAAPAPDEKTLRWIR